MMEQSNGLDPSKPFASATNGRPTKNEVVRYDSALKHHYEKK